MKFVESLNRNKSIVAFLILEILALVSFTFANINDVLCIIGAIISVAAFVFVFVTSSDKKDFYKLIPIVVVLFIVSGIAAFGNMSSGFSTISNISVFFALPLFFSLGFCARRLTEIKVKYVLLAIGFALALITFIGTFATWVDYGFFYSIIYKVKGTPNYYYNGMPYDVTKEMNWLFGFEFSEVSIEYGGLFAVLCGSFIPALLFINPKENKNEFIAAAIIGGVGLVSILSIPNFKALIILCVAVLFGVAYKFLKGKAKLCKGLGFGFVGVISVVGILYLLSIINAAVGFKFLNRLFVNNSIISSSADVLKIIFMKTDSGKYINIMGLDLNNQLYGNLYDFEDVARINTGIFEYQILKEVGLFGSLLFLLFLAGMVYVCWRYLAKENDEPSYKIVFICLLLSFFVYSSIASEILPQTHDGSNYIAFLRSAPLVVMLFIFGYIYFVPKKKEEIKQWKRI